MAYSDFVNRSRGRRRPLRAPSGFVPRLAEAGGSRRPARDQDLAAEGAAHAAAWRKGRAELEGEACPLVQLGSDGRSDPRTLAGASAALLRPTPGRRREARVEEDGVRPRTCDWTLNSGQCSPIYRGTKETWLQRGRAGPHPPPWRSRALLPMAALRTLGSHGASVTYRPILGPLKATSALRHGGRSLGGLWAGRTSPMEGPGGHVVSNVLMECPDFQVPFPTWPLASAFLASAGGSPTWCAPGLGEGALGSREQG